MPETIAPVAFRSTLQDIDGNFSSKRVAAFVALVLVVVGFFADMVGHPVSAHLMDSLLIFAAAGLGLSLCERFAPRG